MRYRLIFFMILLLGSLTVTYAQHHYVVVGAFARESNAQKFAGYVKSLRYAARYELNASKNYFYVYVLQTDNRDEGQSKVRALRQQSEFTDAWLFTGTLGNATDPVVVDTEQFHKEEAKQPEVIDLIIREQRVDSSRGKNVEISAVPAVGEVEPEIKVKGKLFKFVVQTKEGKHLSGEVHHVDFKRSRDIASYKTDTYLDLTHPANDSDPLTIVCGIFGYKEVIKFLDYDNPVMEEGVMKDSKGAWVVSYQLERLKKGDVSVMYHVSFYKDAVVMLPGSKTEMDELVSMMRDNPNYKIKIHGHCNGNHSRKIIALGKAKNYFNIQGSDERNGTAKELSKLRAEAVQQYLVDNGIEPGRSEIYPWGALNMLVSENSRSAKVNDRIEIEITRD
jgi:outer membrane protein OmpA-like peptidoglycan-associated protein